MTEYQVEKILDKKIEDDDIKYLVKWVGWSEKQSTWEPIKHLKNVMNLVADYEKKVTSNGSLKKERPKEKEKEKDKEKQKKRSNSNNNKMTHKK
jgi:hypothetical protein